MLCSVRPWLLSILLLLAMKSFAVDAQQDDEMNIATEPVTEQAPQVLTEDNNAISEEEQEVQVDSIEAFPEEAPADLTGEEKDMLSVLDDPHKYVSKQVEWLVTSIDKFFADEALYKYTTGSYVQLSADALYEEEQGKVGYGANLRARVDLPGTKRRFKLLFDTDPIEKQDPVERTVDETPATAVQESDVYASIQRERERKGWLIRPSIGVKFNFPLEPFAKLRFTNLFPLKRWQMRVDENIYWFEDSGFGSDTTFDFDRPLGNDFLFRASSFARWTEETNYFALSEVLTLFQTLSPKRKISYQIGAYGQTQPTWFMTDYLAVIRYRQNLHKDWLFFEIRPQILYRKIYDWDDEVSVLFRVEWLFGRKYL